MFVFTHQNIEFDKISELRQNFCTEKQSYFLASYSQQQVFLMQGVSKLAVQNVENTIL